MTKPTTSPRGTIGKYDAWIDDGSSAGAADAHIVETDANGDTAVQALSATNVTATGDVTVGSSVRALRVHEEDLHLGLTFFRPTFPGDYPELAETMTGSSAASISGPNLVLSAGPNAGNSAMVYTAADPTADTDRGLVIEFVAAITSAITSQDFCVGLSDTAGTFPFDDSEAHHGVGLIYRAGTDTNWALAGQDGGGTLEVDASSVAVVQDEWHRFRIEVAANGSASLYIDGNLETSLGAGIVGSAGTQRFLSKLRVQTNVTRTASVQVMKLWQPTNEV